MLKAWRLRRLKERKAVLSAKIKARSDQVNRAVDFPAIYLDQLMDMQGELAKVELRISLFGGNSDDV